MFNRVPEWRSPSPDVGRRDVRRNASHQVPDWRSRSPNAVRQVRGRVFDISPDRVSERDANEEGAARVGLLAYAKGPSRKISTAVLPSLDEAWNQALELCELNWSHSTKVNFGARIHDIIAIGDRLGEKLLPMISIKQVLLLIGSLRGRSVHVVKQYLRAVNAHHCVLGLPEPPLQVAAVKSALGGIEHVYNSTAVDDEHRQSRAADPMPQRVYELLRDLWKSDSSDASIRNLTLLDIQWSTGCRSSEPLQMTRSQLIELHDEGGIFSGYRWGLPESKCTTLMFTFHIMGAAASQLRDLIETLPDDEWYIFRPQGKGVRVAGHRLWKPCPADVVFPLKSIKQGGVLAFKVDAWNAALKNAYSRLGERLSDADRKLRLTSHSIRKGAAEEMRLAGHSLKEVAQFLRHSNEMCLQHYVRLSAEERAVLNKRFRKVGGDVLD